MQKPLTDAGELTFNVRTSLMNPHDFLENLIRLLRSTIEVMASLKIIVLSATTLDFSRRNLIVHIPAIDGQLVQFVRNRLLQI